MQVLLSLTMMDNQILPSMQLKEGSKLCRKGPLVHLAVNNFLDERELEIS